MKFMLYGVQSSNRLKDYFTQDTIPATPPCINAIPTQHPIGDIWYWSVEINTMEELEKLFNELADRGVINSCPQIRFGNEYNPASIDFTRSY